MQGVDERRFPFGSKRRVLIVAEARLLAGQKLPYVLTQIFEKTPKVAAVPVVASVAKKESSHLKFHSEDCYGEQSARRIRNTPSPILAGCYFIILSRTKRHVYLFLSVFSSKHAHHWKDLSLGIAAFRTVRHNSVHPTDDVWTRKFPCGAAHHN